MSRLLAALAALLLASAALAQDEKKPAERPADDVDAKTKAAIQREIERAKEDIRNEVRAEIQGAQSAAEFLGTVAEGPKLEFFTLDGYYRVRGQLMVNMDVTGVTDASGHYLFPVPLQNPSGSDTLQTANMRLRLEPTLNVSEHVRVRGQVDVLDNHVLGSSTSSLYDEPGSPYPVPFYGTTRVVSTDDPRVDRDAIVPKRVWAEIQTPVGLLSFGRMPSEWGLGILTHAGGGIDDDLGDTMDRIQFAFPPVSTPFGRLALVPILDYDAEGVLYGDTRFGQGQGQPIDAEQGDDGRTYGVKVGRFDTEDEVRRKHERNEASINWGVYYNYREQAWHYPTWNDEGLGGDYDPGGTTGYGDAATAVHRSAYANIASLWIRYLGPRLRVETEIAGVYGHVGNPTNTVAPPAPLEILLRQLGGTIVTEYKVSPNKLTMGLEIGAASGDDAPGFGNVPSRMTTASPPAFTPYGSVEGAQWRPGTDDTIRNFRFNPAYRVDLVLWRHVLGQVTDAVYVKPTFRWDLLPGLRLDAAVVYSRALFSESTPSSTALETGEVDDEGNPNLGVELDTALTYTSGDGFQAFVEWGILQPLGGLSYLDAKRERAHFVSLGLAARF
ncbi:MAG TPA: TIGR04551 family protein [Anaeromyxobacter sp.]|nr:TIGR04551 family protein [Anaeromyxobacter sp.]